MTTYIALLRGINMAGYKVIKMNDLRICFESMRFKKVRTYIQSGNVLFESPQSDEVKLLKRINISLENTFDHDIAVLLRTMDELKLISESDPFKRLKPNSMPYVTFLPFPLKYAPDLPLYSTKRDLEIVHYKNRELFSVGHLVKGRRGFPNTFIEKEFGILATTRNWNTVKKLVLL